jgi:hypothetical protein
MIQLNQPYLVALEPPDRLQNPVQNTKSGIKANE